MDYLLTGAEMSACDAAASNVMGIPSLVLMERAALSVADGVEGYLQKRKDGRSAVILAVAGRGNNGADALAAGRILLERGYNIRFCRLPGRVSPGSSFAVQENILSHFGAEVPEYSCCQLLTDPGKRPPDLIIDGLFGTGLSRQLSGDAAICVNAVNRCREKYGTYVVAVDIPSGVSSDDGKVMGCAVRCDETRTFAFYKRGHFLFPGASYAGSLHIAQIGITELAFPAVPGMFTILDARPSCLLPARDPGGNKGTFGKVLIIAGRRNMCGAALLAARACMSAGAGMVKIFTHEANRVIVQTALPEALLDTFDDTMTPAETAERMLSSLKWADIAAAGPAMGTDETARALVRALLQSAAPESGPSVQENRDLTGSADASEYSSSLCRHLRGLVLDADAIRILAEDPQSTRLLTGRRSGLPCILTPHLGEFSALAGKSIPECREDITGIVQRQADDLHCTITCKDARTVVASCRDKSSLQDQKSPQLYLNCCGNSGMATAGSGDVLTGITAAVLACFTAPSARESQEDPGFRTAYTSVYLHGKAGDYARERHAEQGMTAGDLIESLRCARYWES